MANRLAEAYWKQKEQNGTGNSSVEKPEMSGVERLRSAYITNIGEEEYENRRKRKEEKLSPQIDAYINEMSGMVKEADQSFGIGRAYGSAAKDRANDITGRMRSLNKEKGTKLFEQLDSGEYDAAYVRDAKNRMINAMSAQGNANIKLNSYADFVSDIKNDQEYQARMDAIQNLKKKKQREGYENGLTADELQNRIDELDKQISEKSNLVGEAYESIRPEDYPGYSDFELSMKRNEEVNKVNSNVDELVEERDRLKSLAFGKQQRKALDSLDEETITLLDEYNNAKRQLEGAQSAVLTGADMTSDIMDANKRIRESKELLSSKMSEEELESLAEYRRFETDEQWTKEQEGMNRDFAKKYPFLSSASSVIMAPARSLGAIEMVNALGYVNPNAPVNTNSPYYAANNYTNDIRDEVAGNMDSKLGQFAYQTGMSIGDMVTLLPLGETGVLAVMGTNSAVDATQKATERGIPKEKALLTGMAAGAAEVVFEKMSLDHLWSMAAKSGAPATRKAVFNILSQSGIEGSEEVLTDIANNITDGLINGDRSEYNQSIERYMESGLTEEEAKKNARRDFCIQLGESFTGGAVSGGVFGVGGTVASNIQYKKIGSEIDYTAKDYRDIAEGIDTSAESYLNEGARLDAEDVKKEALRYADRIENGGVVSEREAGKLQADIARTVSQAQEKTDAVSRQIAVEERNEERKARLEQKREQKEYNRFMRSGGSSIEASQVSSDRMKELKQHATSLRDEKLSSLAVDSYKGQENVKGYVDAIRYAYDSGKINANTTGKSAEEFLNNKLNAGIVMSVKDNALLAHAYFLGQNSATKIPENVPISKLSSGSNAEQIMSWESELKQTLSAVSRVLNEQINEVRSIKDVNGKTNSNILGSFERGVGFTLNADGKNEYQTLIHETMEKVKTDNPTGYRETVAAIVDYMESEKGSAFLAERLESYQRAYEKVEGRSGLDQIVDEYVNDYVAGVFSTDEGIKDFAKYIADKSESKSKVKSTLQAIADFFGKIADEIKKYLAEHTSMNSGAQDGYRTAEKKAREIRSKVLQEISALENVEDGKEKREGTSDSTRFSVNIDKMLNEYTEEEKKRFSNSKKYVICESEEDYRTFVKESWNRSINGKYMLFGKITKEISYIFEKNIGISVENFNLALSSDTIRKIRKDHGDEKTENNRGQRAISIEDFDYLFELVYSPDRIEDAGVYMDNPAVHIIKDGVIIVGVISNRSMLLYPQTMYIKRSKKRNPTPAKDEQASFNTSETARKTVPMSSISQNNENARYSLVVDSEGNELSEGQQDYFKDSVIRDGNGNLKVVYHGTKSDFTVFDYRKIGETASAEGYGFYYTDSKEKANMYSSGENGKVLNGYLNLKKPLFIDKITIKANEVRKLVQQLDPTGDDILSNYDSSGIGYPSKSWYLSALNETVDTLMTNDTDVDLISEIINVIGGDKSLLKKIKDVLGYDGFLADKKYDGFEVYVSFESNQFKNIDNLNPTTDNDIRYSVEIDDAWDEIMRENELMEASSVLKQGAESLGKVELDRNQISKMARELIKETKSKYKAADLEENMMKAFAYMKDTKDVSYDVMMDIMRDIAKPVLEQSTKQDNVQSQDWNKLREYFRGQKIALSPAQKKEVAYQYGSYDNFRRSLFGTVTLSDKGALLDEVWGEIADASGGRLSVAESDVNEPSALMDVIESLKPQMKNIYGMDLEHAAYDLALDIYRRYFAMQAEEKAAVRYANKLVELQQQYRREYNKKYREAMRKEQVKVGNERLRQIEQLKKQVDELQTAREEARQVRDEFTTAMLDLQKQKYEKKIDRLKSQNNEKIADIKAKNANSRWNAAYRKKNTDLKDKLRSSVNSLNKMVNSPNVNEHIKKELVNPTIDVLTAINMDTGKSILMHEKLARLSEVYSAYKDDKRFDVDYDQSTSDMIVELRELFYQRNYTELSNEELEMVLEVVKRLRTQIRNANKLLQNKKLSDAYEAANNIMQEIESSGGVHNSEAVRQMDKYASLHLNAKRWFRKMSGYVDGDFMAVYEQLDEGQRKMIDIQKQINEMFAPVLDGKENQKELKKLISTKPEDLVDIGLVDKNGNPVLVTRDMRLSLILHNMNEGNKAHVFGRGLTVPDMSLYGKGKFTDAYAKGDTYRYTSYEAVVKAMKTGDTSELDAQEFNIAKSIEQMEKDLSDYEKRFLEIAKELFHNYTGKVINDVSEELKGYALARVKNYFPIKTDPDFTKSEFAGLIADGTIEGKGFTKARVRASNPILLEGLTNVILRTTKDVSQYAGLAIPIRNINMLMNVSFRNEGSENSIRSVIKKRWGANNLTWFQNLLQDMQGGRQKENTFFDTLRSRFAGSTLTLNPSVAIKQAASYPTAAAKIGWNPLLKAMKDMPKGFTEKGLEELEKINPLLWYRNQGNSTQELGDIHAKRDFGSRLPKALNWIQWMDTGTVRTLEYASMYYVDENFSNLKKGSEEYWNKVSEVFTDVVQETQPNYTTLQQADIIRNPNKFVKQIFMFKTQPMQNFGLVYDATGELLASFKSGDEQWKKRAIKQFANVLSSQVISAMVFSGMTILANLIMHKHYKYKDDEDNMSAEIILSEFLGGIGNVFTGAVVGGSELYDFLSSAIDPEKTYYGMEVSTVAMIKNFCDDILSVERNMQKYQDASKEADKMYYLQKSGKSAEKLATVLGNFAGVPAGNIWSIIKSVGLTGEDILEGKEWGESEFWKDTPSQYDLIFDAINKNDLQEADRLYNQLIDSSEAEDPESAVKSNVSNKVKKFYSSGDLNAKRSMQILQYVGVENPEDKISSWDVANAKTKLGESYSMDDFIKAMNGMDAKGDIKSEVKDRFLNGSMSHDQAMKYLAKNVGLDEDTAWFQLEEWKYDSNYGRLFLEIDKVCRTGSSSREGIVDTANTYKSHGKEKSDIAGSITAKYKERYLNATGKEKVNLNSALITAYQAIGYSRQDAMKKIHEWK